MSLTRMISLASELKTALLTISSRSCRYPLVRNSKARAARDGVRNRPSRCGSSPIASSKFRKVSSMRASLAAPHFGRPRMRRSAACNSVSPLPDESILVQPTLRIFFVVERDGLLGELERVLRVEHDRELFRALRVLARHDRAGMGPVRNTARMQGGRGRLDSLSRSEISTDIKQNFVRFNVVVDPRNFHRFRVRIEQTRRERADDVAANLECLMDRRRLMDGAGNRLEILCVECEGINVTVPSNDIEGVVRHGDDSPARPVFHQNLGVAFLVGRVQFGRSVKIAL